MGGAACQRGGACRGRAMRAVLVGEQRASVATRGGGLGGAGRRRQRWRGGIVGGTVGSGGGNVGVAASSEGWQGVAVVLEGLQGGVAASVTAALRAPTATLGVVIIGHLC
jgi:hypothetical protein